MKRIVSWLLSGLLLLYAGVVEAAHFYPVSGGLLGNTITTLDNISGALLEDGDVAFVTLKGDPVYGSVVFVYTLVAASGAAASPPSIISPAMSAGAKRWLLVSRSDRELSVNEKAALAGTSGTAPSAANKLVDSADPRLPTAGEKSALGGNTGTPGADNRVLLASEKAAASGVASLNGSSLVVQNPANASATPNGAGVMPITGADGINQNFLPSTIEGEFQVGTASRAVISDSSGKAVASTTTAAQIEFLNTLGSNAQTQIDGKAPNLADPNAHRMYGWNNTTKAYVWWTLGSGLSANPSTNTITATGGGAAGESAQELTGDATLECGGVYLYTGGSDGMLTLPEAASGCSPVTVRNATAAKKVTVKPASASDVLEMAIGTGETAGDQIYCTGPTCLWRATPITNDWLALAVNGTWASEAAFLAQFSSSPASKDFGNVTVDVTSSPQTFTITNPGSVSLTIVGAPTITTGDTTDFAATDVDCTDATLSAGSATDCTVSVTCTPTTAAAKSSKLRFATTELGNQDVNLSCTGIEAASYVWQSGWETGTTVRNTGATPPEDAWNSTTGSGMAVVTDTIEGTKALKSVFVGEASSLISHSGTGINASEAYLHVALKRTAATVSAGHMAGIMSNTQALFLVYVYWQSDGKIYAYYTNTSSGAVAFTTSFDTTQNAVYHVELHWNNSTNQPEWRAWDGSWTQIVGTGGSWEQAGSANALNANAEAVEIFVQAYQDADIRFDDVILNDSAIGVH